MSQHEDTGLAVSDAGFLNRIPAEIRGTFTDQQIAAVNRAFDGARHSVDIRFSVPLPWGGRRYLVLLIGREKRSAERRRLERLRQPIYTALNVLTLMSFGVLIFFFGVGLVYTLLT